MNVLTIDIGGNSVKILASGWNEPRSFHSGPDLTAENMVQQVKSLAGDWKYEAVSIGYPGPTHANRPIEEPHNLGPGWVNFDYEAAVGCPFKLINDAAMQALGSYNGGKMLFLGLGTGLGSAIVVNGVAVQMELAHLPYKKATFEDYVGQRGLDLLGKTKWRKKVAKVIRVLSAAFRPDDIVIGGGNVKHLEELEPGCRAGNNANAFLGGFRLWESEADSTVRQSTPSVL